MREAIHAASHWHKMKSPERQQHGAAELSPELCINSGALTERESERAWSDFTRCHHISSLRRTVRCGAPCRRPQREDTSLLLPAYWLKRAAPTNPGETDQSAARRTNAPVSLTPAAAAGGGVFEENCLCNLSAWKLLSELLFLCFLYL